MDKTVKIIIASHKKYRMPEDSMYLPLHVGAEGKLDSEGRRLDLGYVKDNEGENISLRNPSFCELTGLYWAWKNLDADYIGLAHYRRHFSMKGKCKDPFDGVLASEELKPFIGKVKVFVPNKRRYFIETLYSHYAHTHYEDHLLKTKEILNEKCPEYLPSCEKIFNQTYGYMFNMMIMDRALLDQYCTWLFDILFELEKSVDARELSAFQQRFYGRVSEILFNVWLDKKIQDGSLKREEIKEIKCIHMEKINWWKKGTSFIKAKVFKKKYEGSF